MILRTILNYFTGYVRIKVEGFYIERFINMCISKKILLTDIKREKSTLMYANIGISNYKKIRQIAKKTKTKVKIENKKGMPFTLHKYRKRKIFGFLFLSVILGLIILSNYIWNIEIIGNINIPAEEVLKALEESGLKVGTSKNNMDTDSVINKIRLNRDDIAWIGITVKGTNAIVKIKEIAKPPEIINKNEYCSIIADKTGMITKVNVQAGTAAVKVGDIVEKGETLVEGYIEGKYTGTRYVHSIADIEAKIWYTKKEKQPLIQNIEKETGKEEKKYSIKFKKNQINLFKTLSKFEKYDTIIKNKKIKLFSNFYLPIELVKTINKEYNIEQKIYSEEELTEKIKEKLKQELDEKTKSKNVINVSVNINSENGYVEVEMTYEVLESIGVEQTINV